MQECFIIDQSPVTVDSFKWHLQVVLTSTNPSEICINGMSFSRRASKWANAALVVNVSAGDFGSLNFHGPLAGVEFQVLCFQLLYLYLVGQLLFFPF